MPRPGPFITEAVVFGEALATKAAGGAGDKAAKSIVMKKVWEVFYRFLVLGCVSFGGPAAHIGYFQKTFVEKLQWIDVAAYARLVALSQFLPGPGSSQIGFCIGLRRAGLAGAAAAFIGFTAPSFLLLYLLAALPAGAEAGHWSGGVISGLKLLAVIVVADATLTMFKTFCKERLAAGLMALTSVLLLIAPGLLSQIAALILAAVTGLAFHKTRAAAVFGQRKIAVLPLALFALLFAGLPVLAFSSQWIDLAASFYRAGSLVFGGGHVVLPLLQQSVGEALGADRFLTGYAVAQAVPGPMFSLAAFLGAELSAPALAGALLATLAIFLPGFLLVLGLQGAWESLAAKPAVAGAVWGINAAVAGLLLSALYRPVFSSAVHSPVEMALVIAGFFALNRLRAPIWMLIVSFVLIGLFLPFTGAWTPAIPAP